MEEVADTDDGAHLGQLIDILEHPEKRILPLLYSSSNPDDQQTKRQTRSELVQIAQRLFQEIEENAKQYHKIRNSYKKGKGKDDVPPSLSGLPQLYIPESNGDTDDEDTPLDAETLWGQVELQNSAVHKLLKKSIKRLARAPKDIVVLDMGQLSSDEGEGDDSEDAGSKGDQSNEEAMAEVSENSEDSMGDGGDDDDDDEGDGNDEDEDDEAKHIRQRMEKAMQDMESDEDDGEDDESKDKSALPTVSTKSEEKEELYDHVAEDMKDGFFDLNDMEDFADEEEDYLPDEAYGQPESEKKKKKQHEKSFHQRQRDGDLLDRSDDDDEDGLDDTYEEKDKPVKRKKYREDEDIDALYNLYQAEKEDEKEDDDDSDEEGAVNMTAAEFFGRPNKKHMDRYKTNKAKEEIKGDDDSWGEYDFDEYEQENWRDEKAPVKNGKKESDEDEGEDEGRSNEEQIDADEPEGNASKKPTDNSRQTKQEEKIRKQTEQLEKEMMAEKPWQMTGESKSTSRPVNSLLEGTPEFEMASKQAPAITVEHTANLEDVIKQRIIAEDWDDVVPRELPDVAWNKKRGELPEVSQERSKLGLGELYEREYLKKAIGYDKDAAEKETEEDKAKDEMKQIFANLCSKLDGLSNYQFAPRPISDEAEVRTLSTPAIAMEEILPLHVSDARGVAPEEVYGAKRGREGVLRGDTEMDQQERKRLRQSKKSARRKVRKEKLADEKLISRLEPGLGLNNPYEKRKMREELQSARARGKVTDGEQDMNGIKYGSSGTFFKRLQAEAQNAIQGKAGGGDEARETKPKVKSSVYKL